MRSPFLLFNFNFLILKKSYLWRIFISIFERFLAKTWYKFFKSLLATFQTIYLSTQITLLLYIYACIIKKLFSFTQHFITNRPNLCVLCTLYSPLVILSTCCWCPLLLYPMSSILHFVTFYITFISLDVRPLRANHLMSFLNFFNDINSTVHNARLERKYLVWKLVTIDNF